MSGAQGGGWAPRALASHEAQRRELLEAIRTPIVTTSMSGRGPGMLLDNALEILDTEYPGLTAQEFGQVLSTARRTARRMRTLMEDLLSAGSIQSGHFVVAPRRTGLQAIVDDSLEVVTPSID